MWRSTVNKITLLHSVKLNQKIVATNSKKAQSASMNHALLITRSALVIKKTKYVLCLSQSVFSNFAPHMITFKTSVSRFHGFNATD